MRVYYFLSTTILCLSFAFSLSAQEKITADIAKVDHVEGWNKALKLGSNVNMVNNSSVIGKPEGLLTTLGFSLESALYYFEGAHEWRNTLNYKLSFSRDPALKKFTKPADSVTFESIYLYHIPSYDWVGPFARFAAEAPLLKGFNVQPTAKTFVATKRDGTTKTSTGRSFDLTDPLKPLTLKESLGVFVNPMSETFAKVELRAGVGARQTFAAGQFILADDATTANIEASELRNSHLLGSELYGQVTGDIRDNVTYKIFGEMLTPFVSNKPSGDKRSAWKLTNYDAGSKLDVKLASWATLTHEFKALKQPLLLNKFQFSNSLLLNIGWEIFTLRKGENK